jgi:hypothetical protein
MLLNHAESSAGVRRCDDVHGVAEREVRKSVHEDHGTGAGGLGGARAGEHGDQRAGGESPRHGEEFFHRYRPGFKYASPLC